MFTMQKKILYLSIIFFVVGTGGYFIYYGSWLKYVFAHIGALGLTGLYGFVAGKLAESKGCGFLLPFIKVTSVAILLSSIAAILWPVMFNRGDMPCGGAATLLISIIGTLYYAVRRKVSQGMKIS